MNAEMFMGFAQFGGMALVAGVLLWMQARQDERTWNFMQELRKSIDDLTAAIKNERSGRK